MEISAFVIAGFVALAVGWPLWIILPLFGIALLLAVVQASG